MPAALPIIAGVAAATAVVGTVKTIQSQNKANKLAKEQFTYEKQLNSNRAVRDRRDAIRAGRMASASVAQTAANTGGSESSAALGTEGSIISQLNDKLSFLDTQQGLAEAAGQKSVQRQSAMNAAANWGAVTNLGMAVFSQAK